MGFNWCVQNDEWDLQFKWMCFESKFNEVNALIKVIHLFSNCRFCLPFVECSMFALHNSRLITFGVVMENQLNFIESNFRNFMSSTEMRPHIFFFASHQDYVLTLYRSWRQYATLNKANYTNLLNCSVNWNIFQSHKRWLFSSFITMQARKFAIMIECSWIEVAF